MEALMNTAIRTATARPYFVAPSPIPLAPASSPHKKTLIDLTPKQIKALPLDEFRVLFATTPLRALTREQLTLIDANRELNEIAGEVLDRKVSEKRDRAAPPPQTKTLIGLTSEQIKALPPEELRARIATTPLRALTLEQLALIDAEKQLSKTAHNVLRLLASKKRPVIQALQLEIPHGVVAEPRRGHPDDPGGTHRVSAPSPEVSPTVVQVALPRKIATFITHQVEAGYYRDASELVSERVRLLQREIETSIRDFRTPR
jgi:Bacterial antitoxin of ParD toxin-antitoxin type II system and RHH